MDVSTKISTSNFFYDHYTTCSINMRSKKTNKEVCCIVQGIVVECAMDGTGKRVCGSSAAARREQSRADPVTVTASCCQHYCANCPRILQ